MRDQDKSREQLVEELATLRRRVAVLEAADTERNQAEEALRESDSRFRSLFQDSAVGTVVVTPSGRLVQANKAFCDFVGCSEPELLGQTVQSITHPDDRQTSSKAMQQALTSGPRIQRFDKRYLHKNGQVLWGEVTSTLICDADGKPDYFVAQVLDISERKRAEEALQKARDELERRVEERTAQLREANAQLEREVEERRRAEESLRQSEERFRSYFVQGLVGMAVTRSDTQWQEVNDRLCEILGYPHEELVGMKWTDATHPNDLEIGLSLFNRMIAGEIDHYTYDKRFIRKDGKIVYATMFIRCFRRKDKTIDHILALIEDTTERRQAERALEERSDVLQQYVVQLARINERLRNEDQHLRNMMELQDRDRQLIGFEIHDELAQLLTGAMMYLQGFQSHQESKPADTWIYFDTGVELLAKGIREARRLINGLRPPSLDEAGVVHAIRDLVQEVQSREQPQIEFIANAEFGRLPKPLENTIFRVVQESLMNACRHSKSERVRIELRQEDDRLVIEVRDWGSGFDPQTVAEDRFGLKSIRERARVFGGQATIESRSGEGTRITVELPLLERDAPTPR
jgi:PAS domain S-box-containing protein